jgi:hypothetical protein
MKFHEEWMRAETRMRRMLKGVKVFSILLLLEENTSRML